MHHPLARYQRFLADASSNLDRPSLLLPDKRGTPPKSQHSIRIKTSECLYVQEMVAAPKEHWIHEYHDYESLKDPTNPYMGRHSNK